MRVVGGLLHVLGRHFDFEIRMDTTRRMTRRIVGWHNVQVPALPPGDQQKMYLQVQNWYVGWNGVTYF